MNAAFKQNLLECHFWHACHRLVSPTLQVNGRKAWTECGVDRIQTERLAGDSTRSGYSNPHSIETGYILTAEQLSASKEGPALSS